MLNWIKSLFTRLDRGDAAAERIAVALEQMAGDIEAARDQLRNRLGIEAEPAGVLANVEEPARNGRRKASV